MAAGRPAQRITTGGPWQSLTDFARFRQASIPILMSGWRTSRRCRLTSANSWSSAARGDESARVRGAAVGKLMDPSVLALVAGDDADPGVRAHATSMLRDIALEAFEDTGEADSLAAVDALADAKILSQIVKTATRESVAARALAGRRSARRGIHCTVTPRSSRSASPRATRLREHDELVAVAMNSDFKDTAVAAVDRLHERADLEHVAARSNNKNAMKRARAMLREIDERLASEAAAAARPSSGSGRAAGRRRPHSERRRAGRPLAATERSRPLTTGPMMIGRSRWRFRSRRRGRSPAERRARRGRTRGRAGGGSGASEEGRRAAARATARARGRDRSGRRPTRTCRRPGGGWAWPSASGAI